MFLNTFMVFYAGMLLYATARLRISSAGRPPPYKFK